MKTAFVIIDPWLHCEKEDMVNFPELQYQCITFGHYLQSMLTDIKKYADVYVDASDRKVMSCFEDIKTCNIEDLKYKRIYLGGFHFGRCIHNKGKKVLDKSIGIVNNLSVVFPADKFSSFENEFKQFKNYYFTPAAGFEKIKIVC